MLDADPPDQSERRHRPRDDVQDQRSRDQLARLAHIGAHDVAQHCRIEQHRVGTHVVDGGGRGDDQQRQPRFDRPAIRRQHQQNEVQSHQRDKTRRNEQPGRGVSDTAPGGHRLPPGTVPEGHAIQRNDGHKPFDTE